MASIDLVFFPIMDYAIVLQLGTYQAFLETQNIDNNIYYMIIYENENVNVKCVYTTRSIILSLTYDIICQCFSFVYLFVQDTLL